MSTKIYSGIKFKSKDWKEVMDQLFSIKKDAEKISLSTIDETYLAYFIVGNKLEDKDQYVIFKEIEKSLVFPHAYTCPFRFNFSICLYPSKDGTIYGVYFDSLKGHYELIEPFIEDFHYQNSSDKPNNISDDDWDFRRKTWDELVDSTFSEKAYIFNVVDYNSLDFFNTTDRIKNILPKIRTAVNRENKIDDIIK